MHTISYYNLSQSLSQNLSLSQTLNDELKLEAETETERKCWDKFLRQILGQFCSVSWIEIHFCLCLCLCPCLCLLNWNRPLIFKFRPVSDKICTKKVALIHMSVRYFGSLLLTGIANANLTPILTSKALSRYFTKMVSALPRFYKRRTHIRF